MRSSTTPTQKGRAAIGVAAPEPCRPRPRARTNTGAKNEFASNAGAGPVDPWEAVTGFANGTDNVTKKIFVSLLFIEKQLECASDASVVDEFAVPAQIFRNAKAAHHASSR
jgi:hypothetical protein